MVYNCNKTVSLSSTYLLTLCCVEYTSIVQSQQFLFCFFLFAFFSLSFFMIFFVASFCDLFIIGELTNM